MVIVILEYLVPLDRIEAALDDHREWLGRHYDAGDFVASGPRTPRTGGVIIAECSAEKALEAVASDPFALQGLAKHQVLEFVPSRVSPENWAHV
ncbi:YciI family protein [Tsukamurella pseudospumae]|uniref:YCII-related domain-containing protein n=1 Tax=Tsukamurella pseudospumae TaxID=239498 RepID=A0A138AUX3_9ACTN|nr:YciI family protein [Tsukamurella pseudospumae]KXO96118.1 hypothetical protein AXK61_23685 [Tsukamurella pseudospumae]KXP14255.1 hypothetical protein AXK60_21065 [Tsukamurella pseudospumae]